MLLHPVSKLSPILPAPTFTGPAPDLGTGESKKQTDDSARAADGADGAEQEERTSQSQS
jgi:hypothetical protein